MNYNADKLLSQDRIKDRFTPWTEEEAHAVFVLKIPASYVRLGILTLEEYEEAKEKPVVDKTSEACNEHPQGCPVRSHQNIEPESEPVVEVEPESLSDLSVDELKAMAKERGIKGVHLMKKETLLSKLSASPSPSGEEA